MARARYMELYSEEMSRRQDLERKLAEVVVERDRYRGFINAGHVHEFMLWWAEQSGLDVADMRRTLGLGWPADAEPPIGA